jgi:hypothetical protein
MTNKLVGVIYKYGEWCREYELCSVSVTNSNGMSLCIVVFLTYHGAFSAILCPNILSLKKDTFTMKCFFFLFFFKKEQRSSNQIVTKAIILNTVE